MKIRFRRSYTTDVYLAATDPDGQPIVQVWEFDEGEVFEIASLTYGPPVKVKTRPGHPGGRFRMCTLYAKNENEDVLRPDRIYDVAENVFDIIAET